MDMVGEQTESGGVEDGSNGGAERRAAVVNKLASKGGKRILAHHGAAK
jgi:hypothetical protein